MAAQKITVKNDLNDLLSLSLEFAGLTVADARKVHKHSFRTVSNSEFHFWYDSFKSSVIRLEQAYNNLKNLNLSNLEYKKGKFIRVGNAEIIINK